MFDFTAKGPVSLIFDLDGTLFDSYPVIVSSVRQMLAEYGIFRDYDELYRDCIKTSMTEHVREIARKENLPFDEMIARYTVISQARKDEIKLMPEAMETLTELKKMGTGLYVFTHRGTSTVPVTDHLKITGFFKEMVTTVQHFPRKPEPDALKYLMEKYQMDPESTYYVGDRRIDMECAKNAGIGGILYLPETSVGELTGDETVVVKNLSEILDFVRYCG